MKKHDSIPAASHHMIAIAEKCRCAYHLELITVKRHKEDTFHAALLQSHFKAKEKGEE